jgi:hypothetical protein
MSFKTPCALAGAAEKTAKTVANIANETNL